MKLTLKVKLSPTEEQFNSLKTTMEMFNRGCNFVAEKAFELQCRSKIKIQPTVYQDLRDMFDLSSQMAVRAIAKAIEAYKRDPGIKPMFRLDGAMVYDQRILSWKGLDVVSILTLDGRTMVKAVICDYHLPRLDRVRGQADLILLKGAFYLCVVVECDEPEKIEPEEYLGIDMGIVNLAVDSDGERHSGKQVDAVRYSNMTLKARLQSKGTKSAKRHLRKLSGRDARFMSNTNHIISKQVVAKAIDTGRGISLEDLKGIRNRTTVRRSQRDRHMRWSFYQLRCFIEYKAALCGIPVVAVDPAYTSQTCPGCGCVDNRNRNRQDFICVQCGHAGHADHIAAINIAGAVVNRPIVSVESNVSHLIPPGTSQRTLVVGS